MKSTHRRRKAEPVRAITNLTIDREWSQSMVRKLMWRSSGLNVASIKEDHIAHLKLSPGAISRSCGINMTSVHLTCTWPVCHMDVTYIHLSKVQCLFSLHFLRSLLIIYWAICSLPFSLIHLHLLKYCEYETCSSVYSILCNTVANTDKFSWWQVYTLTSSWTWFQGSTYNKRYSYIKLNLIPSCEIIPTTPTSSFFYFIFLHIFIPVSSCLIIGLTSPIVASSQFHVGASNRGLPDFLATWQSGRQLF